jgi:hypothetical protein
MVRPFCSFWIEVFIYNTTCVPLQHHLFGQEQNTGSFANSIINSQRCLKRTSGEGLRKSKPKSTKVPRKLVELAPNDSDPDDPDTEEYSKDVSKINQICFYIFYTVCKNIY